MADLYLGVEIGGTKQQIAVCNGAGQIVRMVSERVVLVNGASDICAWIEKTIDALLKEFPAVIAIGVGFGGPLETATGRVITSLHVPGWENFELKTWLEEKYPLPVTVVNDTVAGGYAELKLGSGQQSDKFFYTNIGTGIGGSLFVNGQTWDGIGYGGAYFGNTYTVDWTSDERNAVERIEALCSGVQIEKRLRKDGYVPQGSMLMQLCGGDCRKIDCRMLKKAAEESDTFALEELDRIGHTFGMGIANLITILGVDTVAIGGGVANLGDLIIEPIRKYAKKYVFISGKDRYKIVQCLLMDNNVPVGAALYARDGFNVI
ncbi:MAG: ROK family protein [Clostridia bacterium]|nr:ROK family protein [Clostridia bacterium]